MSWDDKMRLCFSNLWNRLSHMEGEKYLDFNKEYADDLLEKYIHEDGEDKVREKYHEFSSRFWEIYLVTSFLEDGFCLVEKKNPEGPDIKIKLGDRIIWVEAVVPGPGGETNNDRVPDLEYGVAREVPDEQMKLRLTNAFSGKFCKYKNYREKDLIKEGDDYVIAINGYLIGSGRNEREIPRIVRTLFPIGNMVYHIRVPNNFDQRAEITEQSHEYQKEIVKCEGSRVPTDPFLNDEYAGISAVLYSDCYLFNFDYVENSNYRRLSRSFTLVHNPKRYLVHTRCASGFLRCGVGYYMTSDIKDKNKIDSIVLERYIGLTKEEEVADAMDQIAKSISHLEMLMTLDSMQNTQKIQNALVQLRECEEEAKKALQETQTIGLESVLITIKEIEKKVEPVYSDAVFAV